MKTVIKISMIILMSISLLQANKEDKMREGLKLMQEAYKKAGIDMTKKPTPQQLKIVQEYMSEALFPKQKQEVLLEAKEAKNDRVCMEKADNLKEANACIPDDDDEKFDIWNENEKSKILKEIDEFINTIPCVEKASTGKELRTCFPDQD